MFKILSLAPFAVSFSAPLAAQEFEMMEPIEKVEREDRNAIPDDTMRQMTKVFANCVYRRHPELSETFLQNSDFERIDYEAIGFSSDDLHDEFTMVRCMKRARTGRINSFVVNMPRHVLRRALAEEAYLAARDKPLEITAQDPEFLPRQFIGPIPASTVKVSAMLGDCIIYNSPARADALVRTRPTTESEGEAAKNLIPVLSGCIAQGEDLNLSLQNLRQIVADGLYARLRDKGVSGSHSQATETSHEGLDDA